jgi:hypothetical protein
VLRAAARRLALLFGSFTACIVLVSLLIGLAAGTAVTRAIATGFYVGAALLLVGCVVTGIRGPLRPEWGSGSFIPKGVRRASADERSESVRLSLLLFTAGIVLIVVGSLVDPSRRAF